MLVKLMLCPQMFFQTVFPFRFEVAHFTTELFLTGTVVRDMTPKRPFAAVSLTANLT